MPTTARRHTRRKATPEQKAQAAERRQRIKALSKTIAAMSESDRLNLAMRINIMTCEGHPLSPFNACLMISQKSDATLVGGFQQWRRVGRKVMKGAHGLALWIPKKPREQEDSEEPNEMRFLLVTVFDVSQTEVV